MNRRLQAVAAATATALAATLAVPGTATAGNVNARTLLNQLPVAVEQEVGYDREAKFGGWLDRDGDGCDTRREVLISEATQKPRIRAGCTLTGGVWHSKYDGLTITDPTELEIDHVVSLSEVWKSGGYKWSQAKRRRYTNDLKYPGTLIAVSSRTNASKGDRSPGEWTTPDPAARCWLVTTYIASKWRWRLAVDSFEKAELGGLLNYCENSGQSIVLKKPKRA